VAATRPVYIAANHYAVSAPSTQRKEKEETRTGYVRFPVGIIPESRNMAMSSIRAYIQKNMTISFLPTAVYLLRIWRIIMAVMIMATIWTKHVATRENELSELRM
jgi:hypothetical protein